MGRHWRCHTRPLHLCLRSGFEFRCSKNRFDLICMWASIDSVVWMLSMWWMRRRQLFTVNAMLVDVEWWKRTNVQLLNASQIKSNRFFFPLLFPWLVDLICLHKTGECCNDNFRRPCFETKLNKKWVRWERFPVAGAWTWNKGTATTAALQLVRFKLNGEYPSNQSSGEESENGGKRRRRRAGNYWRQLLCWVGRKKEERVHFVVLHGKTAHRFEDEDDDDDSSNRWKGEETGLATMVLDDI